MIFPVSNNDIVVRMIWSVRLIYSISWSVLSYNNSTDQQLIDWMATRINVGGRGRMNDTSLTDCRRLKPITSSILVGASQEPFLKRDISCFLSSSTYPTISNNFFFFFLPFRKFTAIVIMLHQILKYIETFQMWKYEQ